MGTNQKNKSYMIGDVISWKVGNILSKGIVYDDFDDRVDVVTFEINGSPTRRKISVLKECIIEE